MQFFDLFDYDEFEQTDAFVYRFDDVTLTRRIGAIEAGTKVEAAIIDFSRGEIHLTSAAARIAYRGGLRTLDAPCESVSAPSPKSAVASSVPTQPTT